MKLAINLDELADQPDEEKTNRFRTHFLDINCGGVYEDGTGTISSPGFPNGYEDNLDCTWLIYRTKETAEFIFVDFATESNYDIAIVTSGRWVLTSYETTSGTCHCFFGFNLYLKKFDIFSWCNHQESADTVRTFQDPRTATMTARVTAAKTSLKKWIRVLSIFIVIFETQLLCQISANSPGFDPSSERERKFCRGLFTSSIKHGENGQIHVGLWGPQYYWNSSGNSKTQRIPDNIECSCKWTY